MVSFDYKNIVDELMELNDHQLLAAMQKTVEILISTQNDGYKHWVVAFSGGKDSSLLVTIVSELLRRKAITDVQVDVVYSDTLMELPPFGLNANALLNHINTISTQFNLSIRTHSTVAPIDQRFWFLVIGKGYPPPHNHFRWCTDRLKIRPSRNVMQSLIRDDSVVLTGVRLGESDNRDGRLKAAQCSKDDSECGQGIWLNSKSEMGLPGLAPIAHWRTCQVWDCLMLAYICWGWPYDKLTKMYGDSPATRFGCWMCTLIREDKGLQSVVRHNEWKNLISLNEIRTIVLDEGRKEENRLIKENGNPGRTTLTFRKRLLDRLLALQTKLEVSLISEEEIRAIKAYWEVEKTVPSPYADECKFFRWQPEKQSD